MNELGPRDTVKGADGLPREVGCQWRPCGDQLLTSAISTGRASNDTNIIHLAAILGLSNSSVYVLKTRDLPRRPAQVHSWAGLSSFAAAGACSRSEQKAPSRCHGYATPEDLSECQQPHQRPKRTRSQTLHLIQFIITTTFECPE